MAFRGVRIPRLTLYSGPNCSLCDTAKSALAKVRQTTSFELDTVNIQDKGQEKWKRKYVYWIPALHLEGKEIAKGRWDESVVIQAPKEWKEQQEKVQSQITGDTQESSAPSFFFHSTPDFLPHGWEPLGIYQRADHTVLGDLPSSSEPSSSTDQDTNTDVSRCFNCGSPSHKLPDCPARIDRDLVALTRQYYHFFQGTLGLTGWKRVHTVEAWRQQRLTWVDEFAPGRITSALLEEALRDAYDGLASDEWLRNISVWGYPRGWCTQRDPKEEVRKRIWDENDGVGDPDMEDSLPFEIYGDNDIVERVSFHRAFDYKVAESASSQTKEGSSSKSDTSSDSTTSDSDTDSESSQTLSRSPAPAPLPYTRWADYPPTYFSSQHLVLYKPPLLPPTETWANTSFENTEAYLYQFHYRPPPPPPPPTDEPPPLPPDPFGHPPPPPGPPLPPGSPPPPPLPLDLPPPDSDSPPLIVTLHHPNHTNTVSKESMEDESDMDFSDSD